MADVVVMFTATPINKGARDLLRIVDLLGADNLEDSALGFGTFFTDHMFNMDYNKEQCWHNPRIEPYAPIIMDPSTMVLHYGQAIFEGLKAYKTDSGGIQLSGRRLI